MIGLIFNDELRFYFFVDIAIIILFFDRAEVEQMFEFVFTRLRSEEYLSSDNYVWNQVPGTCLP